MSFFDYHLIVANCNSFNFIGSNGKIDLILADTVT